MSCVCVSRSCLVVGTYVTHERVYCSSTVNAELFSVYVYTHLILCGLCLQKRKRRAFYIVLAKCILYVYVCACQRSVCRGHV